MLIVKDRAFIHIIAIHFGQSVWIRTVWFNRCRHLLACCLCICITLFAFWFVCAARSFAKCKHQCRSAVCFLSTSPCPCPCPSSFRLSNFQFVSFYYFRWFFVVFFSLVFASSPKVHFRISRNLFFFFISWWHSISSLFFVGVQKMVTRWCIIKRFPSFGMPKKSRPSA